MTFHVLVPDNVHANAIAILNEAEGIDVSAPSKIVRYELMTQIESADAIVIRSGVQADAELLNKATKLKAIARAGVGVDNVDLDVATQKGIVVMNTPGGNTISTAEHAFGLMIALARHIPQGHESLSARRWDRKLFMGVELNGKRLGLIGFGRIGQAVALRARAFGMSIVAYDPYVDSMIAKDMGVKYVENIDELYAESDFISLHALVNDETQEMINAQAINKMKDGVRIVNVARGALINDTDLADAIKAGKVAGAGLDVYHQEPPPDDNPLIGLDDVIHTPHLAASTSDAQVTVAVEAAQLIVDFLQNGNAQNVCNPSVLEAIS